MAVDPAVAGALERGGTVEITTTGRKSGEPRSVVLAFHNVDGRTLLSGKPGFPRSWVANLQADPRLTFRLKGGVAADLPGTARIVSDRGERERLLAPIAEGWRIDLAVMVASAPLVEVTFD
jgi:deazaflavin-dependent oxidoreductase (nitroreductase family)